MILNEQRQDKEKRLHDFIINLSLEQLSQEDIRKQAYRLKDIYASGFRHSYSKFFPIIVDIGKEENGNLEYLSNNLETLQELVEQDNLTQKNEFECLYDKLLKLSDHLNLEIARFNYYTEKEKKTNDLEQSLNFATKNLESAKNELNQSKDKLRTIQTELITVLSIFAAIVMAFSGGMNFISSAFANIDKLAFSKVTFFMLLVGFILINLIFVLMYFISKIIGRNIYVNCKTLNCTCKNNMEPICNGFNRLRKRLPYVFWLNSIIIVSIIIDIIYMYNKHLLYF